MNGLFAWLIAFMVVVSLPFFISLFKEYKTVKNFEREGVKVYSHRLKKLFESTESFLLTVMAHMVVFMLFDVFYALVLTMIYAREETPFSLIFVFPVMLYITLHLLFLSFIQLFGKKRVRVNEIRFEDLLSVTASHAFLEKIGFQKWCDLMERRVQYDTPEFYLLKSFQQDFETRLKLRNTISNGSKFNQRDSMKQKARETIAVLSDRINSAIEALSAKDILLDEGNESNRVSGSLLKKERDIEMEKAPEIKELELLLEEELSPEQRVTVEKTLDEILQKKSEKTDDIDKDMRVNSIVRAARMMNRLE